MGKNIIRYKYISETIYKLLKILNIKTYPVDLEYVIKELNNIGIIIELEKYSEYALYRNMSIPQVEIKLKSKYGATAYFPNQDFYIIFYNDTNQTQGRVNWTISHEIGHIVLKHHNMVKEHILSRGGLSEAIYNVLENEADWFAQDFMCNPFVLSKCGFTNPKDIKEWCAISDEASVNRVENIKNIKSRYCNTWDYKIIEVFNKFINIFSIYSHCILCGKKTKIKKGYICNECIKIGYMGGHEMIYNDGIKLSSENRALVCPICGNENILGDSNFCHICGTYIVQKCIGINTDDVSFNGYIDIVSSNGCDLKEIPDNARFCPKCGSMTSYYFSNILKTWNDTSAFIQNDCDDEEIPF